MRRTGRRCLRAFVCHGRTQSSGRPRAVTFDAWKIPEEDEEESKDDYEEEGEKGPPEPKPFISPTCFEIYAFVSSAYSRRCLSCNSVSGLCRNCSLDTASMESESSTEGSDDSKEEEFASTGLTAIPEPVLCL